MTKDVDKCGDTSHVTTGLTWLVEEGTDNGEDLGTDTDQNIDACHEQSPVENGSRSIPFQCLAVDSKLFLMVPIVLGMIGMVTMIVFIVPVFR